MMLCVESVTKRFGKTCAVDGVSFSVDRGRLLAVIGPSGCGKTTLLRLVAGLERPDSGRILFDGRSVSDRALFIPPAQRGAAMVFQDLALWPHMTAAANVEFVVRRDGLRRRQRRMKALQFLDMLKVRPLERRLPSAMSGGEQQRVALARALAAEPQILMLDEPLAGLDPLLREELAALLRALTSERNIATLYVTHEFENSLCLADAALVLRAGRVEQYAGVSELAARPANDFVRAFVGSALRLKGVALAGRE